MAWHRFLNRMIGLHCRFFFRHFNISANSKMFHCIDTRHTSPKKKEQNKKPFKTGATFVLSILYGEVYLSKYCTTWSQYKINIILLVSVIANIYINVLFLRLGDAWIEQILKENFMDGKYMNKK